MKSNKAVKIAVLMAVSAAACLVAVFMNLRQLDVMFTSLFYIPMILAGIWFYRQIVPLTVVFVTVFLFMDFMAPGPQFVRIEQLLRCTILIAGAVLFYFMGRQLNRKTRELEQSRRQLAVEKERLRITLLSIGDGVASTDESGKLLLMNDMAMQMTGWAGDAVGRPFTEVFRLADEFTGEERPSPVGVVLAGGEACNMADHTVLVSRRGTRTPVRVGAAPIQGDAVGEKGVVLVFRDATAEREKQDKIVYQSLHDQLTALGNRRYLELQTKRLEREGRLPLAVIVGDVNGLKLANDAIGHEMGDTLLKRAADVFKSVFREDDIVCRFGGDEFVVLLPGAGADEAVQIIERLRAAFAGVTVGPMRLSISLGWAVKSDGERGIMEVFRVAEDMMYAGKLHESIETKRAIIDNMVDRSGVSRPEVTRLCTAAAEAYGLSPAQADDLKKACMVRDIGRVAIVAAGADEPSSWRADDGHPTLKRHAEVSYRILNMVPDYAGIAPYVLAHHERWDGAGYPKGLKGGDIPFLSRIIAVTDYYLTLAGAGEGTAPCAGEAAAAIMRHAGTRFDPDVARIFVEKVLPGLKES